MRHTHPMITTTGSCIVQVQHYSVDTNHSLRTPRTLTSVLYCKFSCELSIPRNIFPNSVLFYPNDFARHVYKCIHMAYYCSEDGGGQEWTKTPPPMRIHSSSRAAAFSCCCSCSFRSRRHQQSKHMFNVLSRIFVSPHSWHSDSWSMLPNTKVSPPKQPFRIVNQILAS